MYRLLLLPLIAVLALPLATRAANRAVPLDAVVQAAQVAALAGTGAKTP